MKLKVGDACPDFNYSGTTLHQTQGRKIVFFYPKAFTPGCSNEVSSIQSVYSQLRDNGYTVIGISTDSEEIVTKFSKEKHLDYILVSDKGGKISKNYGVKIGFSLLTASKRVTFIIDENNKIADIWNLGLTGRGTTLGLDRHGEELLQRLKTIFSEEK